MRSDRFDDEKVGTLLERFDEVVPEDTRFLFDLSWDGGDAYGSLMQHYFAVNDVLWRIGRSDLCDESYSPGMGGPDVSDWPAAEYLEYVEAGGLTADDLSTLNKAYSVLHHGLKLLGKDY